MSRSHQDVTAGDRASTAAAVRHDARLPASDERPARAHAPTQRIAIATAIDSAAHLPTESTSDVHRAIRGCLGEPPSVDLGGHPGLLIRPPAARALYVLAHGAGAGMRHAFMAEIAERSPRARSRRCAGSFRTWRPASRAPDRAGGRRGRGARGVDRGARALAGAAAVRRRQVVRRPDDVARARARSRSPALRGDRFLGVPAPPARQAGHRARRAPRVRRRAAAVPAGQSRRPRRRCALLRPVVQSSARARRCTS